MTAFDPDFLSVSAPLPAVLSGLTVRELPFTHFTVLLQPERRLAVATGVNVDGAQLLDLDRGDDWHLDPRVPAEEQTGPEVYADNDLDRGHLVRRRDRSGATPTPPRRRTWTRSPTSTPLPRPRCSTRASCSGPGSRTTSSTTPG